MISKCKLIQPFSCKDDTPVQDVAKKLHEFRQRHIYVVDGSEKPVGIISVSDLLERVIIAGKDPTQLVAKDIMTAEICPFDDEQDAREAYKCMVKKQIISVPITQSDKYVGTLTYNETLKYITNPEH